MTDNFLLLFIVGCEIAFWVVLFTALLVRYALDLRKLSTVLLVSVPLIDVVLLAATTVDLSRGAVATFAHGLAAAYIGFSVAFGGITVRWADSWFAHKFSNGSPPASAPTHGWKLLRYELVLWLRCVLAVVVTHALVFLAIAYVNDPQKTEKLELWFRIPFFTVVLWFIFGPLWVLLFRRSPPAGKQAEPAN